MDISQLLNSNRLPRKQKGEIIGTKRSWFVRFYHTAEDGSRRQKAVKLADKSDEFRSKSDVEPLAARVLEAVNTGAEILTGQIPLSDFVETHYLPWCRENKSAPTANAYTRVWERHWKPYLGSVKLNGSRFPAFKAILFLVLPGDVPVVEACRHTLSPPEVAGIQRYVSPPARNTGTIPCADELR